MLLDFSPGEVNAFAFALGQVARWSGVLLFLAVAWRLGRRLDDWRISALAFGVIALPVLRSEVGWTLIQEMRERDENLTVGQVVQVFIVVGRVLHVALLASLVILSARLVSDRRRATADHSEPEVSR